MREIKFRAWSYPYEKMIYYGMFDLFDSIMSIIAKKPKAHDVVHTWHENNYDNMEFMQYTGLKDKNSKEVYEGDVLADIYVVEWDEGGMKYILTYTQDGHYCMELNELTWEDTVVIGNIYENPDLAGK